MKAQRSLRFNLIVGISGVVIVAVVAVGVAIGRNPAKNRQANQQVIENVQNAPEVSLSIDNSESPPVAIQTAGAKEITGEVFQQLTGLSPNSSKYIAVPSVTVLNSTNKTVIAVGVALEDRRSKEHLGLLMTDLQIEPAGSLSIDPMDWAQPRKNMLKKYVAQGNDVQVDTSVPTIASKEMWLSGSINDFSIVIGMVEFADGTQWITQR